MKSEQLQRLARVGVSPTERSASNASSVHAAEPAFDHTLCNASRSTDQWHRRWHSWPAIHSGWAWHRPSWRIYPVKFHDWRIGWSIPNGRSNCRRWSAGRPNDYCERRVPLRATWSVPPPELQRSEDRRQMRKGQRLSEVRWQGHVDMLSRNGERYGWRHGYGRRWSWRWWNR